MVESLQELQSLRQKLQTQKDGYKKEICVCTGSSCASLGSKSLLKELVQTVQSQKIDTTYHVRSVGCSGLCSAAIMVSKIDLASLFEQMYGGVHTHQAQAIIEDNPSLQKLKLLQSEPFFDKQEKIVLRNAGKIDPDSIEDYILCGGYEALFYALEDLSPEEVIEQVKQSGLRGRGGGGYPTGLKWETVAKVQSDQKYIICNGDEGDPGAFMDRAVMEADPHSVLEGMILAGFACGASKGYIYVRAEYPVAVEKLKRAIKQAKKEGILGSHIGGSHFSFDIEVRLGGGAFVCGEATSLVTSIEGNRGNPRQKPPHLSNYGLWGEPTVLNNVETFANIAPIVLRGADWFCSFGTEKSTGTKVFALSGNIKNTGLVEVPMGITLRELVFDIGGGVTEDKELKAIQTGGPSGGCIPTQLLDTRVDFESLKEIGSIMGSGGLIVIDDSSNMVEVAKFFMDFSKSESCGKCVPCRVGTTQISDLLQKFLDKKASKSDFELLKQLCDVVKQTSLCGLGQSAPNPVLSTLEYFESEYLEGICHD